MKIMSNLRYEAICEIITDQKKRLIEKEEEIECLKIQINNLKWLAELQKHMIETDNDNSRVSFVASDIDFPNSYRKGG